VGDTEAIRGGSLGPGKSKNRCERSDSGLMCQERATRSNELSGAHSIHTSRLAAGVHRARSRRVRAVSAEFARTVPHRARGQSVTVPPCSP